jgi:N-acyl homoserine lactone hydrolase
MLAGIAAISMLLAACTVTTHPQQAATLGKPSSSAAMKAQIEQPGPIQLETINSADWAVPLDGLINLKSPAAKAAGLTNHDEPIHVYAHLLRHPRYGNFLVDTGVSQLLADDPGKAGVGWLVRQVMPLGAMKIRKSSEEIMKELNGKLSGIFLTHMHLDHISGLPGIPRDIPIYISASEATEKNFLNLFVQGTTDRVLEGRQELLAWYFQPDPDKEFEGVIDIFGDGSAYAISVPGHTPGSVAYLIRTTQGPVLLTGDTSHTRWGWEHTVEPGDYTLDHARNLENLKRLKALVERHPSITVRLGHQD